MKSLVRKKRSAIYFAILLFFFFHAPYALYGAEPKISFPAMTQYVIPDPFLGCPAWTFLAPRDWTKQGGVVWTGGMAPAYYTELFIRNPQGTEEFRLFPIFLFADTRYPPLANNAEIRRYTDAASCIREILIPRCRPEIQDGKVIAQEPLPQLAKEAVERARGLGISGLRTGAARMHVEYRLKDRTMEEIFYCVTAAGQGPNVLNWVIERGFSYRAEKGQLEGAFPLLGRIGGSLYENPEWIVKRREELARRVAARSRPPQTSSAGSGPSILDVSRGMAKAQDEFLKGLRQSSAARDRVTQPWTDAFRGVQTRQNPTTGETVYVPNGYQRYYEDNLGRRFGSNDMIGDPYTNYHIDATELSPAPARR